MQGTQPLRFLPCRSRPSRQTDGGDERPAERPRSQQGTACAPQGGHFRLRKAGEGRTDRRKDGADGTKAGRAAQRKPKTGRNGKEAGKPATDAGQTGLPVHRREQNQLAGTGGQMGREA